MPPSIRLRTIYSDRCVSRIPICARSVTMKTFEWVGGKSVDLIGTSPLQDQSGRAVQERDWLVTLKRRDGSLVYMVFIAPDRDFRSLRPSFEQMLRSLRLR